MTISQNTSAVLEHPFMKRAVKRACLGDWKDLRLILEIMQIDTYQETAMLCTRAYRGSRGMKGPEIEMAIREVGPPVRLSSRLPVPSPECVVVVLHKDKRAKGYADPNQLKLELKIREVVKASRIGVG